MKIVSIAHALPNTSLDNAQVIDLYRQRSKENLPAETWDEIERRIAFFINMSGIKSRRIAWDGEDVLGLAIDASATAIKRAGKTASDIDLVIYGGVTRGWLEPSMAVAIQSRLNAENATSFDIVDACAGWARCLHVAHSMLQSGAYKNALIVNLEGGIEGCIKFDLDDPADIKKFGAAATLGNAAAAMYVEADDTDDFYFRFETYPEHVGLCMLPLHNAKNFLSHGTHTADMVHDKFMADSGPLLNNTITAIINTYNKDDFLKSLDYDIIFSHAVIARANQKISEGTGVPLDKHFSTLEEFGNTASATVPLAMSLALEQGKLQRGQRVGIVIGSAGITVAFLTFTF